MPTRNLNTNLKVTGSIELEGILYDGNSSAGTNGQVLSSTSTGTDWVTLSEISGVDGTGTANYLSKWLDANTITNSLVYDNGTNVGIGTTSPDSKLQIVGGDLEVGKTDENVDRKITIHSKNAAHKRAEIGYSNGVFGIRPAVGNQTFVFGSTSINNMLFAADSGTGILRFNTANSEAVRIDSSGNVGIGTTSPSAKLHISEQAESNYFLKLQGTHGSGNTYGFKTNGGNSEVLSLFDLTASNRLAVFGNTEISFATGGSTRFLINSAGKIQIGNNIPMWSGSYGGALFLKGNNAISDRYAQLTEVDSTGAATNTGLVVRAGNVGIGVTNPTQILHVAGNALLANGSSDVNLYLGNSDYGLKLDYSAGDIFVRTSGGNRIVVKNNGNVGIGIDSPTDKLDVAGALRLTSNITFDANKSGRIYKASNHGLTIHSVTGSSNDFAISTPAGQLMIVNPTGTNNVSLIPEAAGNVGIGTTSPNTKLEIAGSDSVGVRVSGGSAGRNTILTATGLVYSTTSTGGYAMGNYVVKDSDGSTLGQISGGFGNANALTYTYYGGTAYNNAAMYILSSNKNVGIGTTNPNSLLHIEGNNNNDSNDYSQLYIKGTGSYPLDIAGIVLDSAGSHQSHLRFSNNGSPKFQIRYNEGNTTSDKLNFYSWTQSSDIVTFDGSTGRVGIGTTSPAKELDVVGTVRAVDTSGNDQHQLRPTQLISYATDAIINAQSAGDDVRLNTQSNTVLIATAEGDVGIGTTSPVGKLNINTGLTGISYDMVNQANGSISFSNNSGGTAAPTITGKSNNNLGLMFISGTNNTGPVADMYFDVRENDNTDYATLTSSAYRFNRAGNPLMTILRSGNVGIGTTNPDRPLHIIGQFAIDNSTSPSGGLLVSPDGNSNKVYSRTGNSNTTAHPLDFISGSSTSMRIAANGDVGIGITAPAYKLSINGSAGIEASEQYLYFHSSATVGSNARAKIRAVGAGGGSGYGGDLRISTRQPNNVWNEDAVTVDSSGNVGIGTTSPDNILHIRKGDTTYSSQVGADTMLFLETTNISNALQFSSSNTGTQYIMFGDDDPNAGWISYKHSDNNLNFRTNGSEKMRILANGNVGIGATAPLRKLHVVGDFAVNAGTDEYYGVLINGGESANPKITIGDWHNSSATIHWDSSSNYLRIDSQHSSANAAIAFTGNDGSSEYMRITSAGNVGIGTTNPAARLHTKETGTVNSAIFENSGQAYAYAAIKVNEAQNNKAGLSFAVGDALASTHIQAEIHGLVTNNGGALTGDLVFKTNQGDNLQERMRILANGNVGIGTTGPATKLHVVGRARFDDTQINAKGVFADYFSSGQSLTLNSGASASILFKIGNTTALTLDSSENATFAGEILNRMAAPKIRLEPTTQNNASILELGVLNGGTNAYARIDAINLNNYDSNLRFYTNAAGSTTQTLALTLNSDQSATFAGDIKSIGTIGVTQSDGDYLAKLYQSSADGFLELFTGQATPTSRTKITSYGDSYINPSNGNVGIGTTSPSEKLHVNGNVRGASFGTFENTTARIFSPEGATFNGSGNQTGYLIVKLPDNAGAGINNMMTGIIRVFDYANNESFDVHFAGYWYSGYSWTRCSAWIESEAQKDRNFSVRFGRMTGASGSEDRPFITIGESNSTWSYCKFSVVEYNSGHSNPELEKWNSGWATDLSATFPGTLIANVSNNQVNNWKRNEQHVYYAGGTGNVGIGTVSPSAKLEVIGTGTQLASTGYYINSSFKGSSNVGVFLGHNNTSNGNGMVAGINKLAFLTYGTSWGERMVIDGSGNVGIGTTAPAYNLTIADALTSTPKTLLHFDANNITNGGGYNIDFRTSSNDTADRYVARIRGIREGNGATSQLSFWTENSGLFQRMTIKADGNVGIGTTSPANKLQIGSVGSSGYSGNDFAIADGTRVFSTYISATSDAVEFYTNRKYAFLSSGSGATGDVGIGVAPVNNYRLEVYDGDYTQMMLRAPNYPTLRFKADNQNSGNNGRISIGANNVFQFNPNNTTNGISIANDGNVGIATTDPAYKLDVNGAARSTHFIDGAKGTGTTPATAGWYKIASWSTGGKRGGTEIKLSTTGGSFTPITWIIRCYKNWSTDACLKLEQYGYANVTFTKARIVQDASTNIFHLEVYQAVSTALTFNMYQTSLMGYDSFVTMATGALAAGTTGGTVRTELPFVASGTSLEDLYVNDNISIGTTATSRLTVKSNSVSSADSGFTLQANASTSALVKIGERSNNKARLHMYASGVEKIAFYTDGTSNHISAGNVGIGTTNPSEKLEVNGNILVNKGDNGTISIKNGSQNVAQLGDTGGGTDGQLVLYDNSGAAKLALNGQANSYLNGGNVGIGTTSPNVRTEIAASVNGNPVTSGTTQTYGALRVRGSATNVLDIGQQSASPYGMWMQVCDSTSLGTEYPLLLNPNGGNVGIGTVTPERNLHVRGSSAIARIESTASSQNSQLDIKSTTATWSIGQNQSLANTGTLEFYNGSSSPFVIKTNGNVGIGTNTPQAYLDIRGGGAIFSTTLTNNDDWQNSAISILERDIVGTSQSADKYSPNLNFHWTSRVSNSLWMGTNGTLNWGSFSGTGIPSSDGTFQAARFNVGTANTSIIQESNRMKFTNAIANDAGGFDFFTRNSGSTYINALQILGNGNATFAGNVNINSVFDFNTSTDLLTITNNQNTGGINLSGGNSRIYFGGSRAIEGDQSGGTLYIGEGYGAISLMDDVTVSGNITASGSSYISAAYDGSNYMRMEGNSSGGVLKGLDGGVNTTLIRSYGDSFFNAGNVGIGTNNPTTKLYIEDQGVNWNVTTPGTTLGTLHLDPVGNGANNTGNAITFGASDSSSGGTAQAGIYIRSDGNYGTKMYLATTNSYNSGSKTRLVIDHNGNVGIGVTSPSYTLQVGGSIVGSSKNFLIDHPTKEGKKLLHGCIEGPETAVYFRGKNTSNIIEMPDYWIGLVDIDTMTVDITAIGPNQDIYVESIADDGEVTIGSNTDAPLNYFYVIYGERKDIDKLEIETIDPEYSNESTD